MKNIYNYEKFLESISKEEIDLPKEVVESALDIAKGMYDKVLRPFFYKEGEDNFLRFKVTDMDYKYIDPNEKLPLPENTALRRNYYVELEYDDQYDNSEVSYKILYEPISDYKKNIEEDEEEFIDKYEEERRKDIKEFGDEFIDIDTNYEI